MSRFQGFHPAPLPLPAQNNCAPLSASTASSASSHLLKRNGKTGLVRQIVNYRGKKTHGSGRSRRSGGSHTPWFGSFPCSSSEGHSLPDGCVDSQAKQ